MIIPLWVNEKKDKELIDWLNTKTNKSAVIREILYAYKNKMNISFSSDKELNKEKIDNLDQNFINSLKGFK